MIAAAVPSTYTQQADSANTDHVIMGTPLLPLVAAGSIASFFYAVTAVAIILHITPSTGSAKSYLSSLTSVHEGDDTIRMPFLLRSHHIPFS